MYLVRKTGRKCMNVDIDKYCSIMEFPFTITQIILGLYGFMPVNPSGMDILNWIQDDNFEKVWIVI